MSYIIDLFTQFMPYSIVAVALPIGYIFYRSRNNDTGKITNMVEVFFKGGTKDYYPCTVSKEQITFQIEDEVYTEPVLHQPRVQYDSKKGKISRVFLFAEGIGNVDVPPLLESDRFKILKYLVDNKVYKFDGDDETTVYTDAQLKDKLETISSMDLIQHIQFYNFDIDQITDKPMAKSFTTSLNAFVSLVGTLIAKAQGMEQDNMSNINKIIYVIVGLLIGSGFTWAFVLKGYL